MQLALFNRSNAQSAFDLPKSHRDAATVFDWDPFRFPVMLHRSSRSFTPPQNFLSTYFPWTPRTSLAISLSVIKKGNILNWPLKNDIDPWQLELEWLIYNFTELRASFECISLSSLSIERSSNDFVSCKNRPTFSRNSRKKCVSTSWTT